MAETNAIRETGGGGVVMTPDPTALTRESIDRDIRALRELFMARLEGMDHATLARINAMAEAVKLVQTIMDRRPAEFDQRIAHLQEVLSQRFTTVGESFMTVDQKFEGVKNQFLERDVRVRETAVLGQTALSAALQTQKESADKSERTQTAGTEKSEKATLELIAQGRLLQETNTRTLNEKIDTARQVAEGKATELAERLTRLEASILGRSEATVDFRAWGAFVVMFVLFLVTLVGFAAANGLR